MTKEDVKKLMFNSTEEEFHAIVNKLSDDDAIEVFRYISEIGRETPLYKNDARYRAHVEKAIETTDQFEDLCAQEMVMKLKHEMEMDVLLDKTDESYSNIRRVVIEEIVKGETKFEKIAIGLIKIEKEFNSFDPSNWKGVEHLFESE